MAKLSEDMLPESDAQTGAAHPRYNSAFIGHAAAERELLTAYQSGRLPHAWIIGGEKGIGKATLAWRFAKFLLANPDFTKNAVQHATSLGVADDHQSVQRVRAMGHGDVQVLRREWNEKTKKHFTVIRAEDARKAIHMFQRSASEGGYRIVILDCAEDLNIESANSLLKLIEEPPERSLFLIVSHQPNRILPTIRSRCRMLLLHPLTPEQVVQALRSGESAHDTGAHDSGALETASRLAHGSVSRALKLLGGKSLDVSNRLDALLRQLPRVDWRDVHTLADSVTSRSNDEEYETLKDMLLDWLHAQVHSPQPVPALAAFAESWESITALIRQSEAYNLDRRALVLAAISHLAKAAETAQGHSKA